MRLATTPRQCAASFSARTSGLIVLMQSVAFASPCRFRIGAFPPPLKTYTTSRSPPARAFAHHLRAILPDVVFGAVRAATTAAELRGALRGKESITMFINSIDGRAGSFVFEFELKLAPREKATAVSDAVFGGVAFAYAECHFKAQAMGGARVLGDGVYLVASGGGSGARGCGCKAAANAAMQRRRDMAPRRGGALPIEAQEREHVAERVLEALAPDRRGLEVRRELGERAGRRGLSAPWQASFAASPADRWPATP